METWSLRVRNSSGTKKITINASATYNELQDAIKAETSVENKNQKIMAGFPPKVVQLAPTDQINSVIKNQDTLVLHDVSAALKPITSYTGIGNKKPKPKVSKKRKKAPSSGSIRTLGDLPKSAGSRTGVKRRRRKLADDPEPTKEIDLKLVGWVKAHISDHWFVVETYQRPDAIIKYLPWSVGPIVGRYPAYTIVHYFQPKETLPSANGLFEWRVEFAPLKANINASYNHFGIGQHPGEAELLGRPLVVFGLSLPHMRKKPLCIAAGTMQKARIRSKRKWDTYGDITIRHLKEFLLAFKYDSAGNKPELVATLKRVIEAKALR